MDYSKLKASNGNGEAVRALVTSTRLAGATVIAVNSLLNWPTNFIATTGKLLASGALDPATILVFYGHTSGSTIVIDSLAPGYTDTLGNAVGDVVIVKPATAWADDLTALAQVTHNNDGTLKSNIVTTAKIADNSVTGAKLSEPIAFKARLDTDRTIADNTYVKVDFSSELYDYGNNFDPSNDRFTAPYTGIYHFGAAVRLSGAQTYQEAALYKNGTITETFTTADDNNNHTSGSIDMLLTSGDYVELWVKHTSGASATLWGSSTATADRTKFYGHLVGRV